MCARLASRLLVFSLILGKTVTTVFKLTRVFRHFVDGVPQISDFKDDPPQGENDLEVRMKHFTEIENFTFLGYVLAHELHGVL